MRTTFLITPSRELVSAIRTKGEVHALTVGTKVVFVRPFATDNGIVPAGTKGIVEFVAEEDGTTWVLIEGIEPALFHWDNRVVLAPFSCEELVSCLKLPVDKPMSVAPLSVPEGGTLHHDTHH